MHFDPRTRDHGLPRNPVLSLVSPRPIGWISTISATGVRNLAPYSFFNAFSSDPFVVGFSATGRKDSLANVAATGCFVVNVVGEELAAAMNATSAMVGADVDEFELAGLAAAPSVSVAAPRVAAVRAALECRHVRTVEITGAEGGPAGGHLVLGEVTGVYIDEAVLTDGFVDVAKLRPLGRLGYQDYAVVGEAFTMTRPGAGG